MGDWTFGTGDVLVKSRDEYAGVLEDKDQDWKIIFGSEHLGQHDAGNNLPRVDMSEQSHDGFDDEKSTIGCFIAAADLLKAELTTHKRVILNCVNGNSRTGHVLIAFLMRHAGMDIYAAEKLVIAAQEARGKKFDPRQTKSLHNYFKWMEGSVAQITSKTNSVDIRGTFVGSATKNNGNKTIHTVTENVSKLQRLRAQQQQQQPIVVPFTPPQVMGSTGPSRPIRTSELKEVQNEATGFTGFQNWGGH